MLMMSDYFIYLYIVIDGKGVTGWVELDMDWRVMYDRLDRIGWFLVALVLIDR
jgi:hypothetical protein